MKRPPLQRRTLALIAVLVPLLASETLSVGPEGFGVLSAFFGLGAMVGALATATFREASWRLRVVVPAPFTPTSP